MSQPNDDHSYETAHLVARLAGEESAGHPRQISVRWLEANHPEKIGDFNRAHSEYLSSFRQVFGDPAPLQRAAVFYAFSRIDIAAPCYELDC